MNSCLLRGGLADVLDGTTVARAKLSKVLAGLTQTQISIRAATNLVGVVVVLTVILPKANRANLVASPLRQRPAPAARAAIQTPICSSLLCDVGEVHGVRSGLTTQAQRPGPRDVSIATVMRWPGSLQRMVRPISRIHSADTSVPCLSLASGRRADSTPPPSRKASGVLRNRSATRRP